MNHSVRLKGVVNNWIALTHNYPLIIHLACLCEIAFTRASIYLNILDYLILLFFQQI